MDLMGKHGDGKDARGRDIIDVIGEEERDRIDKYQSPPEQEQPLSWRLASVCPWTALPTLAGYQQRLNWQLTDATISQRKYLASFGVQQRRNLTKGECSHLIDRIRELQGGESEPATPKQRGFLRWKKAWRDGLTKRDATQLIGKIMEQQPTQKAAV